MLMESSVAVVVGSGAGIGAQIAVRMGAEGADVVLAGRSVERMDEVAAQLREQGRRAVVVRTDLRDPDDVDTLARRTREEFGRVDALVVNSGVPGPMKPLVDIGLDEWRATFDVNVTGVFLCCKAFLPMMRDAGTGSVVVIGSVTGKHPLRERTPYAASKMALVGLVRTLAVETGGYGVRVNVVSPGGVAGERLDRVIEGQARARGISEDEARASFADDSPLGRLVEARDVADMAVFLSSARAGAITGTDVTVAAGLVMH